MCVKPSQSAVCYWSKSDTQTDKTCGNGGTKLKVKVMSICIAPIHETSLWHSGIARIVNGYHSFTCTPYVSSASRMSHSWYSLTPEGWKAE